MRTIRLTAVRALVRFIAARITEVGAAKLPVFAGVAAWAAYEPALADRRLDD